MTNTASKTHHGYSLKSLPVGFNTFLTNRNAEDLLIVCDTRDALLQEHPNLKTIFSLPVFLYVTPQGHTLMNWYSPRTNAGWPVVILEDCSAKFPQVRRLSDDELNTLQLKGALPEKYKPGREIPVVNEARHLGAVDEYQCSGCMKGNETQTCEAFCGLTPAGCVSHYAGTIAMGLGVIALGLPKGFTRFGPSNRRDAPVFESFESMTASSPSYASRTVAPVWMHLNSQGHTLIRWYDMLEGSGHTTVVLEDCRDKLEGALEISAKDINDMD